MKTKKTSLFSNCFHRMKDVYLNIKLNLISKQYPVMPIIQYPCYKSMDEFIDTKQLKAIDQEVTQFIESYLMTEQANTRHFETGEITQFPWQSKVTKSYVVQLTRHATEYDYLDINKPELWNLTKYAKQVPLLMAFIRTLPFEKTARIMIIFDKGGHGVTAHRDHSIQDLCHEFIWFRTNFNKRFYVYHNKQKKYIESYSAWFDTVNQLHGSDPAQTLNFSIRVDGIFNEEMQKKIPFPAINPASRSAYWACRKTASR